MIMSIHQPRYAIFKMFDTVSLLSNGEFVYQGPAVEAITYFEDLGNLLCKMVGIIINLLIIIPEILVIIPERFRFCSFVFAYQSVTNFHLVFGHEMPMNSFTLPHRLAIVSHLFHLTTVLLT